MPNESQQDLLRPLAHRDPQGSLGLDDDPDLAFAGIRALRATAEFCEAYQVARLTQGGLQLVTHRVLGWPQPSGPAQETLANKRIRGERQQRLRARPGGLANLRAGIEMSASVPAIRATMPLGLLGFARAALWAPILCLRAGLGLTPDPSDAHLRSDPGRPGVFQIGR
jgi:hypothetical protein